MEYFGRVFRPPSEANSLIIQATIGCSHNKCRFCDMYKEKRFSIRPVEDILADLKEFIPYSSNIHRIFIGDGDALIMKTEDLLKILEFIKEHFPDCKRITCYATPKSILTKTVPQLIRLRKAGLDMVYVGIESGDDKVLELMNKGVDSQEILKACKMVKEAGIKLSVTLISGLGSKELSKEHAIHSGKLISEIKPEYLGLLTLRAEGQAPLVQDIREGKFIQLNPVEVLKETKLLLENIDSEGTIFRSNHVSNYLNLAGTLNEDTPNLINKIDKALAGKEGIKNEYLRHIDLIN